MMPATAPDKTREQLRFPGNNRPRRFEHLELRRMPEPGVPTLDERIASTWSALVENGVSECPVCAGPVRAAARCFRCGSELS
jgi:hypothetical protein